MTDKGLTGHNRSHQSHDDHLHMLELVDNTVSTLEVNEKEHAPLGQRIRAMGVCFHKKGDLKKGDNYQLCRNSNNPKDTNCFEVRSQYTNLNFLADGLSKIYTRYI